MQLLERPLAQLPAADAERLVRGLFAPDQRFARAFFHYWHRVLGHNEPTARLETLVELAHAREHVLAHLDDPHYYTVGYLGARYEPIGMFGYRALAEHAVGDKLRPVIGRLCEGPYGIAHCVAILDSYASTAVLRTMFASIALKAEARGDRRVLFFTSDHRLEKLYRRFGMDFPSALALPDSRHLVGMFDLERPDNRARLDELPEAA
jgi:hypothetical protein